MGRHNTTQRPQQALGQPQGEQTLSTDAWAKIVKAIRQLNAQTV